ncbi:MAG: hypothetical protein E6J67_12155 [Deltaproteobacteria bacterium]|nr:MAG: hypothetical protein E6J67_12155 [Deltaproteobacteria bacterium]
MRDACGQNAWMVGGAMNKHKLLRALAVATVGVLGPLVSTSIAFADSFPGSVPKAICGPGDHTESGLQGETTVEERFSGDSERAYNCNLEVVGQEPQAEFEGAFSQDGPAYSGDCAYYGTDRAATLQGVKVIDASDPQHPRVSAHLTDTPAALAPHETVQTNDRSHLLVAGENGGPNFAIYDISADCRHPVLKGSINLPGSQGHMGAFAPDGRTYYLTQGGATNRTLHIVDLSDPSHPQELPPWNFLGDGKPHGLELNPEGFEPGVHEGTRVYAGQSGNFPFTPFRDGLVIEDVSDYQFRRPNPQIRIVSTLFWPDQGGAEAMIPVKIRGRPYLISTDESGGAGGAGGWAAACARGASAFGYPNIIDVGDETNPKIIAKLRLEVNDPANCSALLAETPPDPPGTAPGTNLPAISGTTNYSQETCVADNPKNAKMLACSFQNAQLRVFDIRDLSHPKEIAYWKAGAVRTRVLPASGSWAPGSDRTVDKIAHWVRWVKRNGNGQGKGNGNGNKLELWTVSDGHGFQVLRFTENFKGKHRDLFDDSDD